MCSFINALCNRHRGKPNNYSNSPGGTSISDILICVQQPWCDLRTREIPLGCGHRCCGHRCDMLSIFIMEGNTTLHSEAGGNKEVLVFPPKFTDVCRAHIENPCLRPSHHQWMVPHSPIGRTARTCPHPNHPPLDTQGSVFKMQNLVSPVPHPLTPALLWEWIPKGLGLGHGCPVSWVPCILFDLRAFACVVLCWECSPGPSSWR